MPCAPLSCTNALPVPYYCQWESPDLATDIIEGRATPADDPLWAQSGATKLEEYARWANHACGMTCLKMILAARTGKAHPTLELLRASLPYGTYTVEGESIKGLIYAPFVAYAKSEHRLNSRVITGSCAKDLPSLLKENEFFIASVHPSIRCPETTPPRRGGHLILITSATEEGLTFHNPSGWSDRTRANAHVTLDQFERFFAGRGLAFPFAHAQEGQSQQEPPT